MLRAKMRTMFEKNRHVKDVAVLDVLLLKGHQEYQETMNAWKQTPHVMKWFTEEEVRNRFSQLTLRHLVRMLFGKLTHSASPRIPQQVLRHSRRGPWPHPRGTLSPFLVCSLCGIEIQHFYLRYHSD